jgi:predicted N-acetyltransferase YhbS
MSKEIAVEMRPERPEDYAAIHEVNLAAFCLDGLRGTLAYPPAFDDAG